MLHERAVTNTIDNDGVALSLSTVGDGPDLLFVHGLGSAQLLWTPLIETLADRYRCWTLDVRGHGWSGRAPGAYRAETYASDVVAALDHIGAPTVGIGHSLGGVALSRVAAERHPTLRALYALDAAMLRPPGQASTSALIFERQLAMVRRFQGEARPIDDYEAVLADAPNPVGGTNRETMVPAQLRGRADSLSRMDPECMAAALDTSATTGAVPPKIDIALRVIAADPTMGASFRPEYHDQLKALTPHAEIETIMGVGHQLLMMQGFEDIVRNDLARWLDRVTR